MRLTLRVWRQAGPDAAGDFETYDVDGVTDEMSFLELLDLLNERLVGEGREPVAFDSDCREGICGSCGLMIDGQAHGPQRGTATCQLHLRRFSDGDTVVVEPFRSAGFPIVKDLVVDRSAFDRIIEAGGFITAPTGSAPDANLIAVPKDDADRAMDAAACIGCGACVAACPNGAGQLFTAAKLAHLNLLPQGQPERRHRTRTMVEEMERWFGSCTNHRECEAACPKEISIDFIAMLNRDYRKAREEAVNAAQIDRLLASVPDSTEEGHRRRVLGYATTARRIDARIATLRGDLERALRAVDDAVAEGRGEQAADQALELARELDSLERVQPRVDSWLRVAIGSVVDDPGLEPFGEGPA